MEAGDFEVLLTFARRAVRRIVAGAAIAAALSCSAAATPAITIKLLTSDVQVSADGTWTQTSHIEIKAENEASVASVGQAKVSYDSSLQELKIVEAYTRKADGTVIPVNTSAIYDQMPSAAASAMITNVRVKLIVFPQLAAGDTAVYTTHVSTKAPYLPGAFWFSELYLPQIAFDQVHESVTAPESLPLMADSHGVEFSRTAAGGKVTYSWNYAAPTPPAPDVVAVASLSAVPHVFLTSYKDYAGLGRSFAAIIEPMMVPTPTIGALADQITQGLTSHRDQAKAIYEWMTKHIRYVAIELGSGSFVPHSPETTLANGYGDCKDQVVLLGALLKVKGIASEGLLINSGNFYDLPQVPTFFSLDHIIARIPELDAYLDTSAALAPYGVLPFEEYGKPVVWVAASGAGTGTTPVEPPDLASYTFRTDSHIDEQGRLIGTSTTTARGPYAINLRFMGLNIQNVGSEVAAERVLAGLGYNGATGRLDGGNPLDPSPTYTVSGTFTAPGWGNALDSNQTFFIPGGMRLFGYAGDGMMGPLYPGKLSDSQPVICVSAHVSEDLSFQPPSGYRLEKLPSDTHVETANVRFAAHWTLEGQTLSVHREFTSTIDTPLCTPQVRLRNAAALKAIVDNYNTELTFVEK